MTQETIISTLLAIIGAVGLLMVQQLVKIADAVNGIKEDLKVLTNDHSNLKEDVRDVEHRISKLEEKI